jgi:AraC-like DNA-binding protein
MLFHSGTLDPSVSQVVPPEVAHHILLNTLKTPFICYQDGTDGQRPAIRARPQGKLFVIKDRVEGAQMAGTVLAVGEWHLFGRLITSAITNGWSVLHTLSMGDILTALVDRKVDLILLASHSSDLAWERTASEIRAISLDTPIVALGCVSSQDSLLSALAGAAWSPPRESDHSWEVDPDTPLSNGVPRFISRSALTQTLSLLEPTPHATTADMRRAVDFIEGHFSEPISLADAARAASYSRCHFCKLFKEQLGMSFVSYLARVRVRHASDLLVRSELSITDIAFEVGFNDLSHFERVFRVIQRQSPSQYRRKAKQLQRGEKHPPSLSPSCVAH